MHSRNLPRSGMTLVELLVVVTIIMFLMGLTALYFPRYQERELVGRGADQLQGWLLTAKQMAMRDRVPTGLRLFEDSGKVIRRLQYIQQPEDVAQGRYAGTDQSNPYKALFLLPASAGSFGSAELPVAVGDYLELYGSGIIHRIVAVENDKLTLNSTGASLPGPSIPPAPMPTTTEPVNYRLIRQPAPMQGEQELLLPEPIIIDTNSGTSININLVAGQSYYDIVFAPGGALIGRSTSNAQVILWLRDGSADRSTNSRAGFPTLITVQPRTGFIAAHPVAPGADPYVFAQDSRSSGM